MNQCINKFLLPIFLFYLGFLLLGSFIGLVIGLINCSILTAIIIGAFIGLSLGIIIHAIILLIINKIC